jgi:hypothetical protein
MNCRDLLVAEVAHGIERRRGESPRDVVPRRDAVVGGDRERPAAAPDLAVEPVHEVGHQAVGARGEVERFRAVRPEQVSDAVGRRHRHDEEVRHVVRAERLAFQCSMRQVERALERERVLDEPHRRGRRRRLGAVAAGHVLRQDQGVRERVVGIGDRALPRAGAKACPGRPRGAACGSQHVRPRRIQGHQPGGGAAA